MRREFQGRGAGRALVAAVAEALEAQCCQSLMLWVLADNPARRFYERLGGHLLDETQTTLGAVEVAYGWPELKGLSRRL